MEESEGATFVGLSLTERYGDWMGASDLRLVTAIISMSARPNVKAIQQRESLQHNAKQH